MEDVAIIQTSDDSRQPQELSIPVPHGHLAAKAWGSPTGRPILAVHGWQDNANSFDRLAPLLLSSDQSYYIVCLDLSGHGRSSHIGPGGLYSAMVFILDIKYAVDYLGWEKFTIIAHSMGGIVAVLFAGMYPGQVDTLITVDQLYPANNETKPCPGLPNPFSFAEFVKNLQELQEQELHGQKVSHLQEGIIKLMRRAYDNLSEESIRLLMERGTSPTSRKGYVNLLLDQRVHRMDVLPPPYVSTKFFEEIMNNVKADLLAIIGKNSSYPASNRQREIAVTIYSRSGRRFKIEHLEGRHHLHLDNAKEVAGSIMEFLNPSSSK